MAEYEGHPMDPHMFDHLIGQTLGTRNMNYTWRDVSLYALGIGAHAADLPYVYERAEGGLKVFPTFAMIPYLNNLTMDKRTVEPDGTNEILREYLKKLLGYMPGGLHMSMDITIDGRIDPYSGTFIVQDRLNNVLDRGEGKGIVADCAMEVFDIGSNHVATLHSYHYNKAFGGFGGEKFRSGKLNYPDREPDRTVTDHMAENQACIYRLVGDTYNVHVDPAVAAGYGYPKPFMMGMSTYGFGIRMAVQEFFPYEPERITHVFGQVRNVCYPGQDMTAKIWKIKDGQLYMKLFDSDDRILLDHFVIDYKA